MKNIYFCLLVWGVTYLYYIIIGFEPKTSKNDLLQMIHFFTATLLLLVSIWCFIYSFQYIGEFMEYVYDKFKRGEK